MYKILQIIFGILVHRQISSMHTIFGPLTDNVQCYNYLKFKYYTVSRYNIKLNIVTDIHVSYLLKYKRFTQNSI